MYIPMFWIERAGEIAGALLAITGLLALIRSKVVRPLIAVAKHVVEILERLLDAAGFVENAAQEMREFAGAFTLFAAAIKDRVDRHSSRLDAHDERLGALEEMRELVVDLQADVARIDRHRGGRREAD